MFGIGVGGTFNCLMNGGAGPLRSIKIIGVWDNMSPEEQKGKINNLEDISNEELLVVTYTID